jgi:maleylpyruvate isomerase
MVTRHQIDEATQHVAEVQATLLAHLTNEDFDPRRPSRLDGWSIGHLLTHVARNADSVVRRLDGARRGQATEQYPGGADERTREIEDGAGRTRSELLADIAASSAGVLAIAGQLDDAAFARSTKPIVGPPQDGHTVLVRRAREVAVHQVDLGLGYEPSSWPDWLVEDLLADTMPRLTTRSAPHDLVAWLVDRGAAPSLLAWNPGPQPT